MPKFLPLSACLLSVWLLLVSSAHAGPFEDCNSGADFDFLHKWSIEEEDRIFKGCNEFIKQAAGDTRKLPIAYTNRGNAQRGTFFGPSREDLAIADYTKAIEIDPKHAEAYYRRGNVFAVMDPLGVIGRNRERSVSEYDKAIEIEPAHRWAYGRRGYANELSGNHDRAIADYTKHIEMNPKDALRGYWGRGRTYHRVNDYDRAIADYSKVIELDPPATDLPEGILQIVPNYNGYRARADAYFDKKDYDRAIADYTKLVESFHERTQEHQRASMWRLRARAERGDHEYAIAEYTKMIASGTWLPIAYSERARIYFKTGKTAQARADAEKALEIAQRWVKQNPEGAHFFDIRGHVYETLGRRDEAIADYRKALKLNPFQAEWSQNGLRRLGLQPCKSALDC
jgi:tetratricopeptide (TPR) repeat protein